MKQSFQYQLNALFATRERLTNKGVAKALAEGGCRISTPYISQLRRGRRRYRSDEVVAAFARFFGVAPEYFFESTSDTGFVHGQESDRALVRRIEAVPLRELAVSALDLSPDSVELLVVMSERLRMSEKLPRVPVDVALGAGLPSVPEMH
ncbi:transcriptional regulator (plasmid) [Rhodococcus globerulus]|uniref:transcriptional regulator n=1 Tax=Rhodococcus globerulus TaxID=33008 RepID=UPI0039EA768C